MTIRSRLLLAAAAVALFAAPALPATALGTLAAPTADVDRAVTFVRGGADDGAGHDRGDDHGGRRGRGADDGANHDRGDDHGGRRGRGADDGANHDRGDDHGGRGGRD